AAKERGVLREDVYVAAHVVACLTAELRERLDVPVGNVAQREVHPSRREALDREGEARTELAIDALHAVQRAILPGLAAEDHQRAVVEPLLRDHLGWCAAPATRGELEQRALAERDRRHRTGLEVAVLADARGVDGTAVLRGAAVKVDQAGVEVPAAG